MTNVKVERKDVLTQEEENSMVQQAEQLEEYEQLRAKAIYGLFRTGKRRQEVATLAPSDITVEGDFLVMAFTVVKKRKKDVLSTIRRKRFPLSSRYAQMILAYVSYMKEKHPKSQWLFPSRHQVFGSYQWKYDKHLSGRQLLNLVKELNKQAWCHLFRETRGASVVREDERKGRLGPVTLFRVQQALDLEKPETALHYLNRYATETIMEEENE